jgi:hypothetical protein
MNSVIAFRTARDELLVLGEGSIKHERQAIERSEYTDWPKESPDEQWEMYERALSEANRRELPFALGGAFALATYTGRWRNTKDLDLYVRPEDRDSLIQVLNDLGFDDYYEQLPYDRQWIYRGYREGTLVDVIWAMANQRAQVDESWLVGPEMDVRGQSVRIVPPEEMIWAKLYVLQRDRCDFPDVLNLIYGTGPSLDWDRLLTRLGDDWPLLTGVLSVFQWMCPGRALELPKPICRRLHLPRQHEGEAPTTHRRRVDLLDRRPWFMFHDPEASAA